MTPLAKYVLFALAVLASYVVVVFLLGFIKAAINPASVLQSGVVGVSGGPSFPHRQSFSIFVVFGSQGDLALSAAGEARELLSVDIPFGGLDTFRVIRRTVDYTTGNPTIVEFTVVEEI